MKRLVAGIIVVTLAFTLIVVAYARANYNPCAPWRFGRDSDAVISVESKELMQQARDEYYADAASDPRFRIMALTAPVKVVTICGNEATLSVAGAMELGQLTYASVWMNVYNAHHPSVVSWCNWCGKMRTIWKAGRMDQEFCGPQL